jgi:plasmid stabilization system protein ParE
MTYKFLRPARSEVRSIADFYERQVPELGKAFIDELRATVRRILAHPTAWTVLDGEIRRCRLRRFPYGIIYSIEPDFILIISIMHLHRHPEAWRENLEK